MALTTPHLATVPIDRAFPTKLKPEMAYSSGQTFQTWCVRLYPSPYLAVEGRRTGDDTTSVENKYVPVKITHWPDFWRWVSRWEQKMISIGVGNHRFRDSTGANNPTVIRRETDTEVSLRIHFFDAVDSFNVEAHYLLDPYEPVISPQIQVIAGPTVGMGVVSRPDAVICDGTSNETKVGLGEFKPPWVVKTSAIQSSMNRLPFTHFGNQFVAITRREDEQRNVGKGLTQLYHDLITDHLTLGFLATTDDFIFCQINPLDRTELQVCHLRVERADRPSVGALCTVQKGLATLAWLGKKPIFGEDKPEPGGLKKWRKYDQRRDGFRDDEDRDPSYQPSTSSSTSRSRSRSGPSGLRQEYGYQNQIASDFCTPACLKALRDDRFHPGCPNVLYHRSASATLETVLEDLNDHDQYRIVAILGEGRSSRCYSVRTEQGYQVVVKAYKETAEPHYFKQELEVYNHLDKLQGVSIPVIIGTTHGIFTGDECDMIFMSYGGIAAERNPVINDFLAERLVKAFTEIHALGVYHEDLALRNILIDKDRVAIIDFENSHIADADDRYVVEEQEWALACCQRAKAAGTMKEFKSTDFGE